MRGLVCCVLGLVLGVWSAGAHELDGRRIQVTAGDHVSRWAPLSLPYGGPALTDGQCAVVVHPATGKDFPATVREGEFVFVPEGVMPNTEHTYVVEVRPCEGPPAVEVTRQDGVNAMDVAVRGKPLTTYVYDSEEHKPYLWPVLSEGGVPVTRDYPMGEVMTTTDHPHQRSIYTAYGDINGVNLWGERANAGYQHADNVTGGSGGAYGWITASNTWLDRDRQPVISETREFRFYNTPENMRMFDVTVRFTAGYGDVTFNDTKEGGIIAVRVRDDMTETSGSGVITNAEGRTGMDATWGIPSAWCSYSGPLGDAGVRGIAVFDHPSNLRHPTCWHVRDYGLMAANCFGLSHFTEGEENGDYELKNGESLTFAYRVYIHSGTVEQARVAERYADYATPPQATWAGAE